MRNSLEYFIFSYLVKYFAFISFLILASRLAMGTPRISTSRNGRRPMSSDRHTGVLSEHLPVYQVRSRSSSIKLGSISRALG